MSRDINESYEPGSHSAPSWLLSLIFHALLLTGIGWFTRDAAPGRPESNDRPIGVAMVERLPDRSQYRDVAATSNVEADQESRTDQSTSAAAASPAAIAPPVDLAGMFATMTSGDVPALGDGTLPGALGDGIDAAGAGGRPRADGSPTTAMMFGISGSGSRFVYVMDRSDSMNGFGGKPLRAAKSELKRSLLTLTAAQQFQVIFYNEEARPYMPAGMGFTMLSGEPAMLRRAEAYIDSVKAFGGTEHFDALKMALRMGPDVIFFLTDARVPRLTVSQFADVKQLAERSGTSIHTIEFGPELEVPVDSFLRQLASENQGEYRYVQIGQLTDSGESTSRVARPQETPQ